MTKRYLTTYVGEVHKNDLVIEIFWHCFFPTLLLTPLKINSENAIAQI